MSTRANPSFERRRLGLRRSRARWLRALWKNERGVAAVEFAFVVPIMVLVLAGIIQFGMIFFAQNQMANVARETARRVAVGDLTQAQAEQFAQDSLLNWGMTYTVAVTLPDPADPNDTDVDVVITVPMSEASLIDILGIFQTGSLRAAVTMREE